MEKDMQALSVVSVHGIAVMFISMGGFIAQPVKSMGIVMPQCMVLQVDGVEKAELMKGLFRDLGAAVDTNISATKNYQCIVISVSRDCKAKILNYLSKTEMPLVIIVAGIVPVYLPDDCIIQVDDQVSNKEAEVLVNETKEFMQYVCENPIFLMREIDKFKTSNWYIEHRYASPLNVSFHAILEIYRAYYRERHCEADTLVWLRVLKKGVETVVNRMEGIGYDAVQPLRALIVEYIESHPEVILCDIEEIGSQASRAVEQDLAILYDDDFYYFPEQLFRFMCKPLLDTVTIIDIKSWLSSEGFLYCNKGCTPNFTVKKLLTNVYSQKLRARFLKISRDFIVGDGSLALEERGKKE